MLCWEWFWYGKQELRNSDFGWLSFSRTVSMSTKGMQLLHFSNKNLCHLKAQSLEYRICLEASCTVRSRWAVCIWNHHGPGIKNPHNVPERCSVPLVWAQSSHVCIWELRMPSHLSTIRSLFQRPWGIFSNSCLWARALLTLIAFWSRRNKSMLFLHVFFLNFFIIEIVKYK